MVQGTFATVINCMDGRTQLPVNEWAAKAYDVDYVDTITEPGPDKILAEGPQQLIQSIKSRVDISVNKHGSRHIILVAHHDCTGNPMDKKEHLTYLQLSAVTIRSWQFPAEITTVWVDSDWNVTVIDKDV